MTFDRPRLTLLPSATANLLRVVWMATLLMLSTFLAQPTAHAQLRVDISGVSAQQYPVAIADFSGDPAGKQIAEIIRADLTRTGQFRLVNTTGSNLTVDTPIAYDEWRSKGADFIAYGSVSRSGDGRFEVKYRLGDTTPRLWSDASPPM